MSDATNEIVAEIDSLGDVTIRDGSGEVLFESVVFEDLLAMRGALDFAINARRLFSGEKLEEES